MCRCELCPSVGKEFSVLFPKRYGNGSGVGGGGLRAPVPVSRVACVSVTHNTVAVVGDPRINHSVDCVVAPAMREACLSTAAVPCG